MNPEIVVRPAQDADLEALLPLFLAYRVFYRVEPLPAAARAFLERNLADPAVLLLVAERGEEVVGFCQVYIGRCSLELGPLWTVYDLFVPPQGRRGGVARALLQEVDRRAREAGAARLELATAHDNTAAQALYGSLGWEPERAFQVYVRTPGA